MPTRSNIAIRVTIDAVSNGVPVALPIGSLLLLRCVSFSKVRDFGMTKKKQILDHISCKGPISAFDELNNFARPRQSICGAIVGFVESRALFPRVVVNEVLLDEDGETIPGGFRTKASMS